MALASEFKRATVFKCSKALQFKHPNLHPRSSYSGTIHRHPCQFWGTTGPKQLLYEAADAIHQQNSTQLRSERGLQGLQLQAPRPVQQFCLGICAKYRLISGQRAPHSKQTTEVPKEAKGAPKYGPVRLTLQRHSAGERREHAAATLRGHHDLPARAFQRDKWRGVSSTRRS